jgi:hypothetical protein
MCIKDDSFLQPFDSKLLVIVKERVEKYILKESHGPIGWMYHTLNYGKKINMETKCDPKIYWLGHTVVYDDNIREDVDLLRCIFHQTIDKMSSLMAKLLFLDGQSCHMFPNIPWIQLKDNQNDTSHYSVRVWVNILRETQGKYYFKVTKTQNARISKRVNIP